MLGRGRGGGGGGGEGRRVLENVFIQTGGMQLRTFTP